ncbi:hypothetical protein PoB_006230300 [Plakobranchus ocellatus]|uniref:Uncharacterized protein n=1 Tax=Plakobranchus ocellatus TaxID=259542 RepID=A0AAV4CVA3_9GAST|nr:hypothetical protein PoB_006230300 [Plakobranchus ocellatus]
MIMNAKSLGEPYLGNARHHHRSPSCMLSSTPVYGSALGSGLNSELQDGPEGESDRPIGRQAEINICRQTDRQTDRQAETGIYAMRGVLENAETKIGGGNREKSDKVGQKGLKCGIECA